MWRWRGRSARCSMNRAGPGTAGCGGCWDERAGAGGVAVCRSLSGGGGAGPGLRIFAAPAAKVQRSGGPAVPGGSLLGMALLGLRHLPGGLSGPRSAGSGPRGSRLGGHRGKTSAPRFSVFLENFWKTPPLRPVAPEKNIENHENFVCICGKMGYNRME